MLAKIRLLTAGLLIATAALARAQTFVPTVAEKPQLLREVAGTAVDLTKNQNLFTPALSGKLTGQTATEAEKVFAAQVIKREELKNESAEVREAGAFEAGCREITGLVNSWRPTQWRAYRTACFWTQPGAQALKTATVAGNSDQATAAVEVVSDLFWGLRIAVTTAVSGGKGDETGSDEERAQRRLQQLATTGGNLSIIGTYPWRLADSAVTTPLLPEASIRTLLSSYARIGTVVPVLGESEETGASRTLNSKDINANLEVAILQADTLLGAANGGINFSAFGKLSAVEGTKAFHDSIGHKNDSPFLYGQIGVGVRISKVFYLLGTYNKYWGGLKSPSTTLTIGVGR